MEKEKSQNSNIKDDYEAEKKTAKPEENSDSEKEQTTDQEVKNPFL